MLHRTLSEIEFDGKIAEAEAAVQSEGRTDISDNQIDRKRWYNADIRQLVQFEISELSVPNCAEIKSMIDHEVIDCHAGHLFLVVGKQFKAAIEDAFATGLLQNSE